MNLFRKIFKPSPVLPPTTSTKQIGDEGEKLACKFLQKEHRYKILTTKFLTRHGEIDIIARDRDVLVFVEVKTRSHENFGSPSQAVDALKQKHMSRAALHYLRLLKNPRIHSRFDVVEIITDDPSTLPELRLIRNAFELSEPHLY